MDSASPDSFPQGLFDRAVADRLDVEHLCDFEIHFRPLEIIGVPSGGTRLVFVIDHGVARGARLNGEFVSGGDWVELGDDGVGRLDVRATLRTDDGELVFLTNAGRAVLDDGCKERFFAGELIGVDDAYLRSSPLFATTAPAYSWLNGVTTVAFNEVAADRVHYRVYLVR